MKKTYLKTKKALFALAGVFFLLGFIFLNKTPTGNVTLSEQQIPDTFSFVGLLFIFCSTIFVIWAIKKR